MHIDEDKKFDKRNIERNIKNGVITLKDYQAYLAKLPDVSDKIYNPEEEELDSDEHETFSKKEGSSSPKGGKKKSDRGK